MSLRCANSGGFCLSRTPCCAAGRPCVKSAVRRAAQLLMAAKAKIRLFGIADRPSTHSRFQIEKRNEQRHRLSDLLQCQRNEPQGRPCPFAAAYPLSPFCRKAPANIPSSTDSHRRYGLRSHDAPGKLEAMHLPQHGAARNTAKLCRNLTGTETLRPQLFEALDAILRPCAHGMTSYRPRPCRTW